MDPKETLLEPETLPVQDQSTTEEDP